MVLFALFLFVVTTNWWLLCGKTNKMFDGIKSTFLVLHSLKTYARLVKVTTLHIFLQSKATYINFVLKTFLMKAK